MSRPLTLGEIVLFIDSKDRRKLVTLSEGGEHHTHTGPIPFTDVVGQEEGIHVKTTGGANYMVVRPTLAEFVLKMPRGAQVIYPKDLGPILMLADIFPGARVLESGVGSGALSMTMLRAGAEISGYEIREDFAAKAQENVRRFLGEAASERFKVQVRDVYEGVEETGFDRVVLDLPEPWQVVPHAAKCLRPGGIFLSYLPSIVQVGQLREALADSPFAMADTVEFLERGWYLEGRAIRPDHRMVGHTGFLTTARLLSS